MVYLPSGAKLTIVNVLYERGSKPGEWDLDYTYEGKNVEKLKEFLPKLIKTVFNPTTWQKKNTEIKDNTYSTMWYLFKDLDYYSYLKFDVTLKIESEGNHGKAKISIKKPCIVTEYPQETYWQKTFIYEIIRVGWHNLFYNKKIEGYMEWGWTKFSCFEEKLLSYFDKLKE